MFRHAIRHCLIALLLVAAGMTVCRFPTVWHSHGGGVGSHTHAARQTGPEGTKSRGHRHSHGLHHHHSHNGHSHSHSGHDHRFSQAHRHSGDLSNATQPEQGMASANSGWHMHLSLFGIELTIRAPFDQSSDEPRVAMRHSKPATPSGLLPRPRLKTRVVTGLSEWAGPVHERIARLGGIEFGPLPGRGNLPVAEFEMRSITTGWRQSPRDADAPPVPPPRIA